MLIAYIDGCQPSKLIRMIRAQFDSIKHITKYKVDKFEEHFDLESKSNDQHVFPPFNKVG